MRRLNLHHRNHVGDKSIYLLTRFNTFSWASKRQLIRPGIPRSLLKNITQTVEKHCFGLPMPLLLQQHEQRPCDWIEELGRELKKMWTAYMASACDMKLTLSEKESVHARQQMKDGKPIDRKKNNVKMVLNQERFLCGNSRLASALETSIKKPQWLTDVEHQKAADMDMAMTELNCATYVDGFLKDFWHPAGFCEEHSTMMSIFCDYLWSTVVAVMAVWAAILYALAQGLGLILPVWLPAVPYLGSLLQRSMTWQAMHIRCQQLRAWPFILLWGGLDQNNQMWQLPIKWQPLDILRGCIWLMGVPAGLKLNNELAAAIGTMSLHVIQSWSTLLYTLIPAIKIFLYVLGISSFLLGFPAAMVSDMMFLSTFHISCLHHTVAFLHTNQLQALASLLRLFRGWKRNPLRRRLDSFECSVEQLVVGSLMFTPLLLLLPTTSVYYTFFSMIFLTLSSVQVMLHYVVAIFHCFPLSLVATWIIRPKQFPSGVWLLFEEPIVGGDRHQGVLLSTLGIRTASLGEFVKPFLRTLWVMPKLSSAASFLYKVVSGERYHLKLRLGHMAARPHSPLSVMGFARLSYLALRRASPSITAS